MTGTVIYLHGFGSAGNTPKCDAIKSAVGAENVISPDMPTDPDAIEEMLDIIVKRITKYPVVAVGTSLGGFWASYLAAKWDIPCVIVNPAISPSTSLADVVDKELTNFVTGEKFSLTSGDLAKYHKREAALPEANGKLINLFVAKDDARLSSTKTLDFFPFTNSTTIEDTGGHRFEENWPKVVTMVSELVK